MVTGHLGETGFGVSRAIFQGVGSQAGRREVWRPQRGQLLQLVAEGEVGMSPEGAGVPEVPHAVTEVLVPEESPAATRSS